MAHAKRVSPYPIIAVVLMSLGILLAVNCAGRKQVKQGNKMLELGNYYGAAVKYLEALEKKDREDALTGLTSIAKRAYEQKLGEAEGYKEQGNLERALDEFRELKTLSEGLDKHNVMNFVPAVDVKEEIDQLSAGAAESHYLNGEYLFEQERYQEAIEEYGVALGFVDPYKDVRSRISECHFQTAEGLTQQRAYREAVESYRKAAEFPDRTDALQKASEILYQLGLYFLGQGHCRRAYDDFSEVQKILPGYRDVSDKLAEAACCAEVKIAFVRFDNPTGRDVAGMAVEEFIFDEIKSKVQAEASQFVRMLDRDELAVVMSEQELGLSGLTEDSAEIGQLKGVDYLIFGKITQVNVEHGGVKKNPKVAEYTRTYKTSYTDDQGKKQTKKESKKEMMHYSENTDRLVLSLSGSIKVIEVRTGEVTIFHRISEKEVDQIKYGSDFDIDIGAGDVSVSRTIKDLAKARNTLLDEDTLAKKQVAKIGSTMSGKILKTIDVMPEMPDPEVLPLSLATPTD